MSTPIVEFVEVSKVYRSPLRPSGTVEALRGVSFRIDPGEVFAVLGPNRAGKTTLLKILLGLCHPTSGRALRLGQALSDRETLARVGYMHENQAFPGYLTAVRLLQFYGELSGTSRSVLKTRIPELLQRVGLADRSHEAIARYSKGMVQRLALAQALVTEPDLLVLDEPMEGLDLTARRLLQEIIAAQRQAGKSVLIVSHALAEVAELCDRLAVLVQGRLAYLGTLSALLRDPDTGQDRSIEMALGPIYGS